MKRSSLLWVFSLFSLVSLLPLPGSSYARTWLVRQDGSGDCTTIQACCDSAGWYDTVLVGPGVYNERVDVPFCYGRLSSEGGPSVTVISPPTSVVPAVEMGCANVVEGFTLRCQGWGIGAMAGGAVVYGGTLRNCVIVNCTSAGFECPGDGAGIAAIGNAVIEGNTIVANGHCVLGGGIFCASNFTGRIERNIIALNTSGYGIYCYAGANPTFICNDVWGNAEGEYGGSCGDPTGTNGNISADPLFCDFEDGDYRLRCDSPCLNAAGCGRIGALDAGCGPTAVTETTWGRVKVLFR